MSQAVCKQVVLFDSGDGGGFVVCELVTVEKGDKTYAFISSSSFDDQDDDMRYEWIREHG